MFSKFCCDEIEEDRREHGVRYEIAMKFRIVISFCEVFSDIAAKFSVFNCFDSMFQMKNLEELIISCFWIKANMMSICTFSFKTSEYLVSSYLFFVFLFLSIIWQVLKHFFICSNLIKEVLTIINMSKVLY